MMKKDFNSAEINKNNAKTISENCRTKPKDKKNLLRLEIAEDQFFRTIQKIKQEENELARKERNRRRRGRK